MVSAWVGLGVLLVVVGGGRGLLGADIGLVGLFVEEVLLLVAKFGGEKVLTRGRARQRLVVLAASVEQVGRVRVCYGLGRWPYAT